MTFKEIGLHILRYFVMKQPPGERSIVIRKNIFINNLIKKCSLSQEKSTHRITSKSRILDWEKRGLNEMNSAIKLTHDISKSQEQTCLPPYSGWILLISLKSCFGIIFSVIISLLLDKYPEKQG